MKRVVTKNYTKPKPVAVCALQTATVLQARIATGESGRMLSEWLEENERQDEIWKISLTHLSHPGT